MLRVNGAEAALDAFYEQAQRSKQNLKWYWKGYRSFTVNGVGYRKAAVPNIHKEAFLAGVDVARFRCHEDQTHRGVNEGIVIHPFLPC